MGLLYIYIWAQNELQAEQEYMGTSFRGGLHGYLLNCLVLWLPFIQYVGKSIRWAYDYKMNEYSTV
jgi:hypothetical protein